MRNNHKRFFNGNSLLICILFISNLFFFFSCANQRPPLRQLTEDERNVRIIEANQSQSMQLNKQCTITKRIGTFNNKGDIRTTAVLNGANVAQILYTKTSTSSTSYNNSIYYDYNPNTIQKISYKVRFFKCKGGFYGNL